MRILTERLALSPVKINHLSDLFRIYGDPKTNHFNPAGPFPDLMYTKETLEHWINHWQYYQFGMWSVTHRKNPEQILGFCGLTHRHFMDRLIINLGYRFAVDAWGNGYATEVADGMLQAGFEQYELPLICATVREYHHASTRVLLKAGMNYVSTIKDQPEAPACHFYQLTREKWYQKHNFFSVATAC
ncbi:MAG: hypothetical protein CENE_03117 [Candidatus Celerinatantimonas neptuna]|nr:MAG: hypothetical protein CENE_03117 [Candidatus Celerinatantimonas neptuna]